MSEAQHSMPPSAPVTVDDPERQLVRLAVDLGRLLERSGAMLVTAESCTGGMIARALTEVGGSSAWFDSGFITYSNTAKRTMLGVAASTLDQHGAVSEPVAREMAAGALSAAGVSLALSVTGIAGPGGGAPGKPVGTVCFGWTLIGPGADEPLLRSTTCRFDGDRASVRMQAACHALAEAARLWRAELTDRPPAA